MDRRQTCTYHCSACASHFHGLGAFDAHRRAGQCLAPATAESSKGRQLLQIWTDDGYCSLENGDPVDHVTVWQTTGEKFAGIDLTASEIGEEGAAAAQGGDRDD